MFLYKQIDKRILHNFLKIFPFCKSRLLHIVATESYIYYVVWSFQSIIFIDVWKLTYQMVKISTKKNFSSQALL